MVDQAKLKADLWKRMEASPFLMVGLATGRFHHEPLVVQLDADSRDTLWFFVNKDNRVAQGGWATAEFVSKGHDYFASFAGTLTASDDRNMVDKLWSKPMEAYFPGGKSDPTYVLMRFDISDAELWEVDLSLAGRLKLLVGIKFNPSTEGAHAIVDSTAG